jgi:hypothetical protein
MSFDTPRKERRIPTKTPERLLPVVQCRRKAGGFASGEGGIGWKEAMWVKMAWKTEGPLVRMSVNASTVSYFTSTSTSTST